jgi:hypothetical protein
MLKNDIRVSVVFAKTPPAEFKGYSVIDGDSYDVRFRDAKNVIVGLKFKQVRNKFTRDMKFVVQD